MSGLHVFSPSLHIWYFIILGMVVIILFEQYGRKMAGECSPFVPHTLPHTKIERAVAIAPAISKPCALNPITYNSSDSWEPHQVIPNLSPSLFWVRVCTGKCRVGKMLRIERPNEICSLALWWLNSETLMHKDAKACQILKKYPALIKWKTGC